MEMWHKLNELNIMKLFVYCLARSKYLAPVSCYSFSLYEYVLGLSIKVCIIFRIYIYNSNKEQHSYNNNKENIL